MQMHFYKYKQYLSESAKFSKIIIKNQDFINFINIKTTKNSVPKYQLEPLAAAGVSKIT